MRKKTQDIRCLQMIGTFPLRGVAWDYCKYAVGLEQLGLEVYYLEDSGDPTYAFVPSTETFEVDPDYGAAFLQESLAAFSETVGTPRKEPVK